MGLGSMVQRVAHYLLARPLLLLLLGTDIIFITVHVWLWARGDLPWEFNLGRQASYPEIFQYLKWLTATLLCAVAFVHRRDALYLAWAALFLYLLLDDSLELHETISAILAQNFQVAARYGLRGKDFMEIAVSLSAATMLLGAIALCYWRSKEDPARTLTWALLPWLSLLAFCGIALEMVKRQLRTIYGWDWVSIIGEVLEDGGEMIAASFLAATVVYAVLRSGAPIGRSPPAAGRVIP
jgi:hypothetical protein